MDPDQSAETERQAPGAAEQDTAEPAETTVEVATQPATSVEAGQPDDGEDATPDVASGDGAAPPAPVPEEEDQEPLVESLDAEELRAVLDRHTAAMGGEDDIVPTASELRPRELRGALEALLLIATRPLSAERIAALLPGTDLGYLEGFLAGLADRYTHEGRGWDLQRIAGGWQLLTRAEFHPWVRQLDRKELPGRLGRSALETLAIIAYKQPVSRGQIEDIRGVQSGPMIRQLMDLKLVRVLGRSEDLLGKPLLYGTTPQFCERFGIGSPEDLPRRHELA